MCDNALKSENSNCTLNDENSADLQRLPSCLLKCTNLSNECEKSHCCFVATKGECDEKE